MKKIEQTSKNKQDMLKNKRLTQQELKQVVGGRLIVRGGATTNIG